MSKPMLTKYIAIAILFIASGLTVYSMHILELTEITKADQRVGFTQLIAGEDVSEGVLEVLYLGLLADYCGFIQDKERIVFRYTLQSRLNSTINSIEELFDGPLRSQHNDLAMSCTGLPM